LKFLCFVFGWESLQVDFCGPDLRLFVESKEVFDHLKALKGFHFGIHRVELQDIGSSGLDSRNS
jgi:hypothetical protein